MKPLLPNYSRNRLGLGPGSGFIGIPSVINLVKGLTRKIPNSFQFSCHNETDCAAPSRNVTRVPLSRDHSDCPLPQYAVLSCVLSFFPVAVFLRMPILVKMALLLCMGTVFVLVIEMTHLDIFNCYDERVG